MQNIFTFNVYKLNKKNCWYILYRVPAKMEYSEEYLKTANKSYKSS